MTIVLDGSAGITNDGGYTGDGVVFADTTPANTLVTDTSGNVGIGGSPDADAKFQVVGGVRAAGGSPAAFNFNNGFTFQNSKDAGMFSPTNGVVGFATGGSERARIDSSGNLLVGTTTNPTSYRTNIQRGSGSQVLRVAGTQPSAWGAGSTLLIESTSDAGLEIYNTSLSRYVRIVQGGDGNLAFGVNTYAGWTHQFFESGQAAKRDGAGSWVGISDERLKTNFSPITASEAWARISKLTPTKYQWADQESHSGQTGDQFGFKAQDWQKAYPNSVYEMAPSKEEQHLIPEGEKALGLAFNADFYADLVAIIQEQQAIITALTARVSALEGTKNV